jgi:hypothetical protein
MMISYDDSRFGNFYWGVPDFHDYMISYEAMMIYDDNLPTWTAVPTRS